jgi:curved DNA-binding protein CbpA
MDLTKEEINQIQRMHQIVNDRDFYLLLDVSQGSSLDEIKKSYYATSRKWHPDRFFRRDIGEYENLLETIFIGINQAFKTLTTIEERTLFDKQYVSHLKREDNQNTSSPLFARHRRTRNRTRKVASERKKNTGKKEKILNRMKTEVEGKRRKAETFFALGKKQLGSEKPMEAAASLHVAFKLEPENKEYQELYQKARAIAREEKAKSIFSQAENAENYQNYHDAIRLYRKALEYDIADARAYARLAYLIEKLEPDVRETIRLMRIAVQKSPENPEYRCILAEIYSREGMERNARREFNQALSLQKGYARAKEGLKNL